MCRSRGKGWASLDGVARSALVDSRGRTYAELRRTLKPRWGRVAVDVALGYVALLGTGACMAIALARVPAAWPITVFAGAVGFGYWHAYLQLFMHEAAHYNFAPSRKWNDRLASVLIAVWIGSDLPTYRAVHWDHHRHHGDVNDSEHQYFSALDARFVFETLLLVRSLRLMLDHRRRARSNPPPSARGARRGAGRSLLVGVTVNLGVIVALVAAGLWPIAAARAIGVGMFLPFFSALRQLLEHRSFDASATVDYTKQPHGRTTRMFHEGLIGSTFGPAGFARHLLHHWEPSLSYTNLAEVEDFLRDCEPTRDLVNAKTTYLRAFFALYGR